MKQIRTFAMRSLCVLILPIWLCLCLFPIGTDAQISDLNQVEALIDSMPSDWPNGPEITSTCAIVMDADTGTILYAKNATQTHYPASTTKIMTGLLAIENSNLDATVRFSNNAVNSLPLGSSHIAIKVGEELSVEDCLYGLLLPSANEVANGLAEHTSGSIASFVDLMNLRAAQIGTVNTHFSNPTGLHAEDHYTCAYDLAIIMRECVNNATFRTIDATPTYTIQPTNKQPELRPIGSTHSMMRTNSEYYDSRVVGGKTGWTTESGRNLITYAYDNGMHLIVVTMGTETPYQYLYTEKLLDFAFSSFTNLSAASNDPSYGSQAGSGNILHLPLEPIQFFELNETSRVTLPNTVTFDALTASMMANDDGSQALHYTYKGYPVGTATLRATDLSGIVTDPSATLLPEKIGTLHNLNLWYVVLGGLIVFLIALILFQIQLKKKKRYKFHARQNKRRRR